MRELVYLSDSKLEQFLPELRSFWPRPKVNLKLPILEIGMEPAGDAEKKRLKHLARVIAEIERSARWFTEPDIATGQWVHFEAPLNYLTVNTSHQDVAFFVDRGTASKDYPTGGTVRLLLHCSGTHLIMGQAPVKVSRPVGELVKVHSDIPASFPSSGGWLTVDNVEHLLQKLRYYPQPADTRRAEPLERTPRLPVAISRLLLAIDGRVFPETAAWMAGYARISANLTDGDNRYVVASPLYVEYATPPR
ncbi:MAG TPA: SAVMC3_10250 family protein [Actinophytocola sp.]|uniref:SAVMC3_10250 family protein n=1 Tax=Actinophytocola sp. TaxID=1872138 RepID=UPI002DFB7F89|nr:SAVMC3_10250 family protein [Actinophytocola sp.]